MRVLPLLLVAACVALTACSASPPPPAASSSGPLRLQSPNGLPDGLSPRVKRIPGHVRYLGDVYSLVGPLAHVVRAQPSPPPPAFLAPAGLACQTSRYRGMWAPVPGGTVYPAFAIRDAPRDEQIALCFPRGREPDRYFVFYRYARE